MARHAARTKAERAQVDRFAVAGLRAQLHTSVTHAAAAFGGATGLTRALLKEEGKDTSAKSREYKSARRSVERWLKAERGESGETRKPSKARGLLLDRITAMKEHGHRSRRADQVRQQGRAGGGGALSRGPQGTVVTVRMSGTVSIQGYEEERDIDIDLTGAQLEDFLSAGDGYASLAHSYGVNELSLLQGTLDLEG